MSENRHKNIHFLMCDSVQDISHFICSLCYLFLLVVCDKHNRFKMTKSFFQTVPPCESFLSNHKLTQIRNIQYCLSYLRGTILTTFSGVQAQNLRPPEKEHSSAISRLAVFPVWFQIFVLYSNCFNKIRHYNIYSSFYTSAFKP